MLRGHQSLSRLVGKRRRLDNASSSCSWVEPVSDEALETGTAPLSITLNDTEAHSYTNKVHLFSTSKLTGEDSFSSSVSKDLEKENVPVSWVKCPVCEKDMQADNGFFNTHLDLCLLEKSTSTSNKLISSQLRTTCMPVERKTLSLKKAKSQLAGRPNSLENTTGFWAGITKRLSFEPLGDGKVGGGRKVSSFEIAAEGFLKANDIVEKDCRLIKVSQNEVMDICNCPCHGSRDEDKVHEEIEPLDLRSCLDEDKEGKACSSAEVVVSQKENQVREVLILETVIVGRKFNRHTKVEKDMVLKAVREPENPKDVNAIKIVGPDDQGNLTLGHLPRNLASHLTGLLDKGHLKIEGFVLRVPEKATEPVPIKLFCEKILGERDKIDGFEETWQKIMEAGSVITQKQDSISQQSSKYVHNYIYLIKTVLERDSHLFDQKELEFLGSFFSLTESAQSLFVRLSQRKGPWFRVSQINYAEIQDVEQASNELLALGFFTAGDSIEEDMNFESALKERMQVLNVPELKHILSMVNLKIKRVESCAPKRDDLLNSIVTAAKEKHHNLNAEGGSIEVAFLPSILNLIGLCVRISDTASFLLWRLQRLFFLNSEQDISSFLLVNMGIIKYPSYVCNRTRAAFLTREALQAYEQALEVGQAMDVALEKNDLKAIEHCINKACMELGMEKTHTTNVKVYGSEEPEDRFLARFSAAWVFATVITVGVSVLEREHRYAEAVKLFKMLLNQSCCPGRRGYWTVRLSIDLEHLGFKEESLETAEEGLNDSRIRHGDRVALQRRVLRLGKPPRRWKKPSFAKALAQSCKEVTITGRPINCQIGKKSRFYGFDDNQCSVEELALQHYAGESGGGWQGVHSESGIWITFFALLMWDVLFADVPNVFYHPFQSAPLDLCTDAFYPARQALIEKQLKRIQCGEAPDLIASTWSKWFGTFCRGLNWERHSLQELQAMASCIGGCGLASICRLLAEDYGGLAGGMPDLFLWRRLKTSVSSCGSCCGASTNTSSSLGEAKLVEVKGPRDRLSEQQRAWISILMEAGINVEVCKVRELPKT